MKKGSKPKNTQMRIAIAIFGLGILCALISIAAWIFINRNTSSEKSSALLVVVKPDVVVERDDGSTFMAETEHDLFPGDNIKTTSTGTGYIIFADNSTISLDINTEIEIDSTQNEGDAFEIKIKQLAGKTWSRVENLVGKKSNYSVETPNTIAAVRGTIFSCEVLPEVSTCAAIEHSISLKLKNNENIDEEIVVEEGFEFSNEDGVKDIENIDVIKEMVRERTQDEGFWPDLNECLKEKSENILATEDKRILDFLRRNFAELNCDITEESTVPVVEPEESPSPSPTASTTPAPEPKPTLTGPTLIQSGNKLICSWKATDATSYTVSISSVAGANSSPWATIKTTTYEKTDATNGVTYYCNVNAKGDGGSTGIKTSKSVYFDISAGTVEWIDPPQLRNDWAGTTRGYGKYSNIPFANLKIKYYVKRSDNGYYLRPGPVWASGLYWIVVSPTQDLKNPDAYNFTSNMNGKTQAVNGPFNVDIHVVLYNGANNNILGTKTIRTSNNW